MVRFKRHFTLLILPLLACVTLLAACSGGTSSTSQAPTVTPTPRLIGVATVCLTVNTPSFTKLSDGKYILKVDVVNCGTSNISPVSVNAQINAMTSSETTNETTTLGGSDTIPPKGKAIYQNPSGVSFEIQLPNPPPATASVTITVTVKGDTKGEWDGQVPIPA